MEENKTGSFLVLPSISSIKSKKRRKKERKWEYKKYLETIRINRATFNNHYRSQKEMDKLISYLDVELSFPKVLIGIILMYITYLPYFKNELGVCSLPTGDNNNFQTVSNNSNVFGIFDLNSFSLKLLSFKSNYQTSQGHSVPRSVAEAVCCKPYTRFYILDIGQKYFSCATRDDIYLFIFPAKLLSLLLCIRNGLPKHLSRILV